MNEAALTDLAATVAERLCGTHEHVCVALIRHLAAGQPVSAAHLAADIAMEEPAVSAVWQQRSDVAYDGDGQVVGFGLSLVPTAHQFTINSQTLYTWCARSTRFCIRRCLASRLRSFLTVQLRLGLSRCQ